MSTSNKPLEPPAPRKHTPLATYRLQFSHEFDFAAGVEVADYLRDLGISDCYASPLFKAGPQSSHGYDVCGFDQLNPELGDRAAFDCFSARLRTLGLQLLLDMVPNHMGNDSSNGWWTDLLEFGPDSPYADFFDIAWRHFAPHRPRQVLLPILEDHYGRVLEAGKIHLEFEDGRFAIAYYGSRFPVALVSYPALVHELAEALRASNPADPQLAETLDRLCHQLRERLTQSRPDAETAAAASRELRELQDSSAFCGAVEGVLRRLNGQPGNPHTFDFLDDLLQEQHYRLAGWRIGPEEINYRRFFDVNSLVALRMERKPVFEATHRLVFEMIRTGHVSGLRIDHPDGLWDPKAYFDSLQANAGPLYVVVEKILSGHETLPNDWCVAGSTGYDFLNQVNGLFVHAEQAGACDRLYRAFSGYSLDFEETVALGKKRVLEVSMVSERNRLTDELKELASQIRSSRDFSRSQLEQALIEFIAAFPVYRTYLTTESISVRPEEQEHIRCAFDRAKTRRPDVEPILGFICDLLLLRLPDRKQAELTKAARHWIMRFQQLTGPVAAKGVEDTAFYRYHRLVSLNEVGGDPARFGVSVQDFHHSNEERARSWKHTLLATATHDTKRGEDTRARINVLSEMPEAWGEALQRWRGLNADKKSLLQGQPAPDANDEYLLYQTLLGAWPEPSSEWTAGASSDSLASPPTGFLHGKAALFRDRIIAYMQKALREAKMHTTWTDPNKEYEEATQRFIEQILHPESGRKFLADFTRFQAPLASFGRWNSLAQLVLKMTSPGVPDFYQGTELWDLSLVDPDNRRPVDYPTRRALLEECGAEGPTGTTARRLLQESHTGAIKLFVVRQVLAFRQAHRSVFEEGDYCPINAVGPKKQHLCAFLRKHAREAVLVVVPRLVATLTGQKLEPPMGESVWLDTALELRSTEVGPSFRNIFTSQGLQAHGPGEGLFLPLAEVLKEFPVALLQVRLR